MSKDDKQSERELIHQDIKGEKERDRPHGTPRNALTQPVEHGQNKSTPSDDPPRGAGQGK